MKKLQTIIAEINESSKRKEYSGINAIKIFNDLLKDKNTKTQQYGTSGEAEMEIRANKDGIFYIYFDDEGGITKLIENPSSADNKEMKNLGMKLIKENFVFEAASVVKSFADKTGKSVDEVEKLWDEAKTIAKKEDREEDYPYITGILKKMLKINEQLNLNYMEPEMEEFEQIETMSFNDAIEQIILETMSMVTQTHLYHLFTKSYAEHVAIGSFYEDIQKDADGLAEMYIARYGEFPGTDSFEIEINTNYETELFLEEIHEFREMITYGLEITSSPDHLGLQDVLIDIQSDIDQLIYKLGLNESEQ